MVVFHILVFKSTRVFIDGIVSAVRRRVPSVDLFEAVRQGRIKAVWIMATNPVASLPNAEEIGDYHRYVIDDKVTLPRQKSAMLAIVNEPVQGTRVSIYNQAVQAKFPLLGIRDLGGLCVLALHPQVIGRPSRLRMLDEFVGWVLELGDVRIAAMGEIAAEVP